MRRNIESILIVEDDSLTAKKMKIDVESIGYNGVIASTFDEAERKINAIDFKLAMIDIDLGGSKSGLDLLSSLNNKSIPSVVTTGYSSPDYIEKAYELGCDNYITKPCTVDSMKSIIDSVELSETGEKRFDQYIKEEFSTVDIKLLSELKHLRDGSIKTKVPVLLQGPTGTGKTTLARAVHFGQYGHFDNFFELNCSTIKAELAESLLFGHKRGSFSGAKNDHIGIVEKANGGTLFLDEIGTLPIEVQNKLLKVLEEKKFFPLGSTEAVTSNFRLISATKDNLMSLIKDGKFRDDLFYRISGINLTVPSLSDRPEDIDLFINLFSSPAHFGRAIVIKPDAMKILKNFSWPGNVRQIKKFFESRKGLKVPIITRESLPIEFSHTTSNIEEDLFLNRKQLEFIEEHGLKPFIEEIKVCAVGVFQGGARSEREIARRLKTCNHTVRKVLKTIRGEQHV